MKRKSLFVVAFVAVLMSWVMTGCYVESGYYHRPYYHPYYHRGYGYGHGGYGYYH